MTSAPMAGLREAAEATQDGPPEVDYAARAPRPLYENVEADRFGYVMLVTRLS
jgi:hypothetical protein